MTATRLSVGLVAALVATSLTAVIGGSSTVSADVDRADWLGIVNAYRGMSGLAPVAAEPAWAGGAQAHSCYMVLNDISHAETPGQPGYSAEGHTAGTSGNVAVSGSVAADARSHVDLWMTGPFHAIGILRHNLTRSAYGECEDANAARWKSAATLDVLRGVDGGIPRPSEPTVFPGNGATVPLYRFVVESPDPLAMCGWAGEAAGLPLIAMLPNAVGAAQASLHGPAGPIETCVLHAGNVSQPTARSILAADHAVVVMPRAPLADGPHSVSLETDAGPVSWSFHVDRNASLSDTPAPVPEPKSQEIETTEPIGNPVTFVPNAPYRLIDTRIGQGAGRLRAGEVTRIAVGGTGATAVSANFVAVGASGPGYLTAYNCTAQRPTVSMLGYQPGQAIANQTVVPLDDGHLCLFSKADVDVVIDVNGLYTDADGGGFHAVQPQRVYDTRPGNHPLASDEERPVTVAGIGAPHGAAAVALNVTAFDPDGPGFVQVYPCGAPTAAEISTINYLPGDVRPNSVVVPLDLLGRVCLRSKAGTHAIVDITGYFADDGHAFQPLAPVRVFDSRDTQAELNPSTGGARAQADAVVRIPVAGRRGVPAGATSVSVNLTATDPDGGTFLTAFPCGARPHVSNLNIGPGQLSVANGAVVQLSAEGELCVYTKNAVHIVVDVNGVFL